MDHRIELVAARLRLGRGRLLLEQQRTRVAKLEAAGRASRQSELLLREMERAVTGFHQFLMVVRREIEEERAEDAGSIVGKPEAQAPRAR